MSPTLSEQGFVASVRKGVHVINSSSRPRVEAPLGFAEQGGIAGNRTITQGDGIVTFSFEVQNNYVNVESSVICVGVIDASKPLTATGGGYAIGLHIGRGKMISSFDGHAIRRGGKALSRDTPRRLPTDDAGRITILVICNMATRRMGIAIGQNKPLQLDYLIPESVRPWVWFGGPGAGSVGLAEYTLGAPPETSNLGLSAKPHPKLEKTKAVADSDRSESATGPTATNAAPTAAPTTASAPVEVPLALASAASVDLALDIGAVDANKAKGAKAKGAKVTDAAGEAESERESTVSSDSTNDPIEWTERATAWLMPLQRLFANREAAEMSAEEAAKLEA